MIPIADLEQVACDRLIDAKCLFYNQRFDGAVYLAGYALEIALKIKLCKNEKLPSFPENKSELTQVSVTTQAAKKWFKHSLIELEKESGLNLSRSHLVDWSTVKGWDVEARYKKAKETQSDAEEFIDSTEILLKFILGK